MMPPDLTTVCENLALIKARLQFIQDDLAGNLSPRPEGIQNALTLVDDSARIIKQAMAVEMISACPGAQLDKAA